MINKTLYNPQRKHTPQSHKQMLVFPFASVCAESESVPVSMITLTSFILSLSSSLSPPPHSLCPYSRRYIPHDRPSFLEQRPLLAVAPLATRAPYHTDPRVQVKQEYSPSHSGCHLDYTPPTTTNSPHIAAPQFDSPSYNACADGPCQIGCRQESFRVQTCDSSAHACLRTS